VRRETIGQASVASIGGALLDAALNGQPLDQSQLDAKQLLATDAHAIQAAFADQILPDHFVRTVEGP
jgi:hypothetical protein